MHVRLSGLVSISHVFRLSCITEAYRGLPYKVKEALHWGIQHLNDTTVDWFVKADDDMFVRVDTLGDLLQKYNPRIPMIVGRVEPNAEVLLEGKWKETKYKARVYPWWPRGSGGYAVSRKLGEIIAYNKDYLINYQGEDTSMGIWIDESSRLKESVRWINSPYFQLNGQCENLDSVIVGHDLTPDQLRKCFQDADEVSATHAWNEQRAPFDMPLEKINDPE
jgi:Galactosyltransferase